MILILLTQFIGLIYAQYILLEQINLISITEKELTILIPKQFQASELDFSIDYESQEKFNISIAFTQEKINQINIEYSKKFFTLINKGSITIPKIEINNNSYCYLKIQVQNANNVSLNTYFSDSQDRQVHQSIEELGILRNNSIIQYTLNMQKEKSSLAKITLQTLQGNCLMKIKINSNLTLQNQNQIEFNYSQSQCIFNKINCNYDLQIQSSEQACQYRLMLILQNKLNLISYKEGDIFNIQLINNEQYILVKDNNLKYAFLICSNQIQQYYEQNENQYVINSNQIEIVNFEKDLEILLFCTNCVNDLRCQYISKSQSLELNQTQEIQQKENSYQFFHFASNLNIVKLDIFWKQQCKNIIYASTIQEQFRPCNGNKQYQYRQVNQLLLMTKTNYLYFSIFVNNQVSYNIKLYDPVEDLIKINTPIIKQICQYCYNELEFISNSDDIFLFKLNQTEKNIQLQIIENDSLLQLDNKISTNQLLIVSIKIQYHYKMQFTSFSSEQLQYQFEINSFPTSNFQLVISEQQFFISQNQNITYIIQNKVKPSIKYFIFIEEVNLQTLILQSTNQKQQIQMIQIKPNIIQIQEENDLQFQSFNIYYNKILDGIYYELSQDSFQNQLISQAFNYQPIIIKKQNQFAFTIQTFPSNYLNFINNMNYKIILISTCGISEENNICSQQKCETLIIQLDIQCDKFIIQFILDLNIDKSNFIIMSEKYTFNQEEKENIFLDYLLQFMLIMFIIILMLMIRREYKKKQIRKLNQHNKLEEHKEDDMEDINIE